MNDNEIKEKNKKNMMNNNMMMGNMNNMMNNNMMMGNMNNNMFGNNNIMGNYMIFGNNMMMGNNMNGNYDEMSCNNINNNMLDNNLMMNNNIMNCMNNNMNGMNNNMMNNMNNNMFINPILGQNNQMFYSYGKDNAQFIDPMLKGRMNNIFQKEFPDFNPLNPDEIKNKESWEQTFLKIYDDFNKINNGKKQENEIKIFINYYDLVKKEIYADKELKVEYLISDILSKMGLIFSEKKYKRTLKKQTTKFLIENPIMEIGKDVFEDYELLFNLEYNGKALIKSFDKKLYEIGLIEGKEINILLIKNLTKQEKKENFIFKNTDGRILSFGENKNITIKNLLKRF